MENKYFTELAHRLQAAGITTGHPERNQLTVLLNDQPVLFVSSESDVFLLPAGSNPPEASELYHKVAQTAEEVYAYVEAIQTAPLLHASGLSEKFHLLADFGGAVLAGRELGNGWGYQFVTWIWDHDRTGVSHGHYYLAKRLDSFDDGEAAQFQGMAHKLGLSKIKDLINLTFCCQKATVITDFSDLEKIGREHYMNLNGGCARTEDLEALDGTETAYADKQELEESIIRRHYGTIVMDSEQPQGGGTSAGGMAQGIQAAPDFRKTVFRP